jgi:hypothetical protein
MGSGDSHRARQAHFQAAALGLAVDRRDDALRHPPEEVERARAGSGVALERLAAAESQ